jgi:hypothetical protein
MHEGAKMPRPAPAGKRNRTALPGGLISLAWQAGGAMLARMEYPINESAHPATSIIALTVAPAAAGAGIGMLVAETLDRDSRRVGGVVLLAVAALAAVPWLVNVVGRKVAGPRSRRGSQRTLQHIRDGGVGDFSYDDYNFDDLDGVEGGPVR